MKINFLLCCLMCYAIAVNSQELSPLELVTKIFTDKYFVNEIPKYSTENYGNYSNATTVNPAYQLSFKLLANDDKNAVVNVTLDSLRTGKDIYIHLKKEDIWKIAALKSLPINNEQQENWQSLEAKKVQIDRLKIENMDYQAPVGFYRNLAHTRMWFALDNQIIDHFKTNEVKFSHIIREIKGRKEQHENDFKELNPSEYIVADYRNLLINSISNSDYCEGCYDFVIDEFVYASLGYLHIPDEKNVPKMNDETGLIVLRDMGDGWYFYKKN